MGACRSGQTWYYRSTDKVWQATPKQCPDVLPCAAAEMIRWLAILGDLPVFSRCQTSEVVGQKGQKGVQEATAHPAPVRCGTPAASC